VDGRVFSVLSDEMPQLATAIAMFAALKEPVPILKRQRSLFERGESDESVVVHAFEIEQVTLHVVTRRRSRRVHRRRPLDAGYAIGHGWRDSRSRRAVRAWAIPPRRDLAVGADCP